MKVSERQTDPTAPSSAERAKVLFLHAPKTAGTTFTGVLEGHFSEDEICPAYYWRELLQIPRSGLARYRLIRGHFDYTITELLPDVQVVTVLREPVARTISHYRYLCSLRRHPLREVYASLSIPEVLQDPELGRVMRNPQVTILGRDSDLEEMRRHLAQDAPPLYPWESRPRSRPPSLKRAIERIEGATFVGLQERFDDSLLLLADAFGWPPQEGVIPLNVTAEGAPRPDLGEDSIAAIEEANDLDIELYRYSQELFSRRFRNLEERTAGFLGCSIDGVGRSEISRYLDSRGDVLHD